MPGWQKEWKQTRTFDLGVGNWGGTPWPGIPSFVVTHRTREDLLGDNGGKFAFDSLRAAAQRAKQAAQDKDVFVLGADVSRQLLSAGLLDEIWLHIVPILLGGGTPLFAGGEFAQDRGHPDNWIVRIHRTGVPVGDVKVHG